MTARIISPSEIAASPPGKVACFEALMANTTYLILQIIYGELGE